MIFILGGKGFVGSAFVRYAKRHNLKYCVITRENYDSFIGKECNIFINADGNSKKYLAKENPKLEFELSVNSVINSLQDFKFNKYILLSTIDVYHNVSGPTDNHEDINIDVDKLSNYGFHKYLAETITKKYAKQWMIIRFGGFIGENLKKNPIYDLLHEKPLWVNIKSQYQYINTDSAAQIVLELIKMQKANEIFNVCGDGTISLEDVLSFFQKKIDIHYTNNVLRIEHYEININKLKAVMEVPLTQKEVKYFINQFLSN